MKKEEFDELEISERSNYVWDNGDYIALREYKDYLIGLYVLNGFFVEVYYKTGKEIRNVQTIDEEKILELYMADVDFSPLLA